MQNIIKECNLHVVSEAGHQFEPFGATYVYVLEESHFSIHTYPEKNAAYMDIFCCNLSFDCEKAINSIKKSFNTISIDCKIVYR
jgi:S-adenosylmethionine decarboxylase proenzyme